MMKPISHIVYLVFDNLELDTFVYYSCNPNDVYFKVQLGLQRNISDTLNIPLINFNL